MYLGKLTIKKIIFTLSFVLCLSWSQAVYSEPLDNLESIVKEAGTLQKFLSNKDLQIKYLNALKEYMGDDKVEESKYWEILDEVQKLDNSVPGFSDRVWKVQPPEDEFTLQLTTKTSGRNVDSAKFQEFIKEKVNDWTKLSKSDKEIKNALSGIYQEKKQQEERIAKLPKSIQQEKLSELHAKYNNDPRLKAYTAQLLVDFFSKEETQDWVRNPDPERILAEMQKLYDFNLQNFPELDNTHRAILKGYIAKFIPSKSELLKNIEIFPKKMVTSPRGKLIEEGGVRKTKYRIISVPRLFHALFKGLPPKECVAECPSRFATPLIKDSKFFHVEEIRTIPDEVDNKIVYREKIMYAGFQHLLPAQHSKTNVIYGDMDIAAPILASPITLEDSQGLRKTTLFQEWLPWSKGLLKKYGWENWIISKSTNIDNSGTLKGLRKLPEYGMGGAVAGTSLKRIEDPIHQQILESVEKAAFVSGFEMRDAGNPIALNEKGAKDFEDPLWWQRQVDEGKNLSHLESFIEQTLPNNILAKKIIEEQLFAEVTDANDKKSVIFVDPELRKRLEDPIFLKKLFSDRYTSHEPVYEYEAARKIILKGYRAKSLEANKLISQHVQPFQQRRHCEGTRCNVWNEYEIVYGKNAELIDNVEEYKKLAELSFSEQRKHPLGAMLNRGLKPRHPDVLAYFEKHLFDYNVVTNINQYLMGDRILNIHKDREGLKKILAEGNEIELEAIKKQFPYDSSFEKYPEIKDILDKHFHWKDGRKTIFDNKNYDKINNPETVKLILIAGYSFSKIRLLELVFDNEARFPEATKTILEWPNLKNEPFYKAWLAHHREIQLNNNPSWWTRKVTLPLLERKRERFERLDNQLRDQNKIRGSTCEQLFHRLHLPGI